MIDINNKKEDMVNELIRLKERNIELELLLNKYEQHQMNKVCYKDMLNNSRDVTICFNLQTNCYEYISPSVEEYFGYCVDECMNMGKELTIQMVYPDDLIILLTAQKHLESSGVAEAEYRQRHKDGSSIWVSNRMTLLKDESGRPHYRLNNIREITKQKDTQENLKLANQKINDILDSIQADFYVLDYQWNFVYTSKTFAGKAGKVPEDFIGKSVWEILPKHLGTVYEENMRTAMEKRKICTFEVSGIYTNAYYTVAVFPSQEGITILGLDITKRRQVEIALKQSEEQLLKAKDKLKRLTENQSIIIAENIKELQTKNKILTTDIELAKNMQMSLLPKNNFDFGNIHLCYHYVSANSLSGDFINYFKITDKKILIYLSDVSGHGIPSAMLNIYLYESINNAIKLNMNSLCPSKVLKTIFNEYNESEFEDCLFIVLLMAIYDLEKNTLTYSSAGLNTEPILVSANGCSKISLAGFPICKLIDIHKPEYKDEILQLAPKDKIFFYTDGLIERNAKDFDEKKLMETIAANYQKPASEINKLILEDSLTNNESIKDDITYLFLEVN